MTSTLGRLTGAFALAVLAILGSACSSPSKRIEDNPELFARLPPEQQALIREGRVGLGFNEDAVKLALGDPDRVSQRTDEQGISTVWRYVEYETDAGAPLYTGYYHRYYAPLYAPFTAYPYYADYPGRTERDVQRVIFRNGKVVAVEQELR
jgi:hypothetical protein